MGIVLDKTKTRFGKARPFILISAIPFAIAAILLVAVPKLSPAGQKIWVAVTYNIYYSIAFTMYNMSHLMMVPLSTRNNKQRTQLSVFNNIANVAMTGIIVALCMPILVEKVLGYEQEKWVAFMSVLSIISVPFSVCLPCARCSRQHNLPVAYKCYFRFADGCGYVVHYSPLQQIR